jgi:Tol biopolymer transport system component
MAFEGALPARGEEVPRLFAIQRDGTGLREIAKLPSVIGQVKFSPDGSKLVFSAVLYDLPRPHCFFIAGTPPTNGKIFLMNSDGSHQHPIGGYSSAFNPSFTADGRRIVFTAFDTSAGTCVDKLLGTYSINLDGTDAKLIVPDAIDASVSSDGSKLVYRKTGGLYVSDADGSNEKLVGTFAEGAVFNPRDSSEVMLVNIATSTIFAINLSDGKRKGLLARAD